MSFEKCPSIMTNNARFLMTCNSDVTVTPKPVAGDSTRDDGRMIALSACSTRRDAMTAFCLRRFGMWNDRPYRAAD
jgi:hypothetical protein